MMQSWDSKEKRYLSSFIIANIFYPLTIARTSNVKEHKYFLLEILISKDKQIFKNQNTFHFATLPKLQLNWSFMVLVSSITI
jgi:hypothetical protein